MATGSRKVDSLLEWLGITSPCVVAVAGSGGKTSTLLRIAAQGREAGLRAAVTCTTRMRPTEVLPGSMTFLSADCQDLADGMEQAFEAGRVPFLFAGTGEDGKIIGLLPKIVDELSQHADLLVVESDGARGLPLKFPAEHEPSVPSCVDFLVVVVGASALRRPAGPDTVFRLELASGIVEPGDELTPETVARLMHAPNGFLRFAGRGCEIAFLVNQEDAADPADVRELCERLGHGAVSTVASTAASAGSALRVFDNDEGSVAAVVLAAGESRRYGSNKLVSDHGGRPLVSYAVEAAIGSGADAVFVVIGHEKDAVRAAIGEKVDVTFIANAEYRTGMSSSIKAGLKAAAGFDAVLIVPGDMPLLTAGMASDVIRKWKACSAPLCHPKAAGRRGHPVLFRRDLFPELFGVKGDTGGRSVADRHAARAATVDLGDDSSQADVDRSEDHGLHRELP